MTEGVSTHTVSVNCAAFKTAALGAKTIKKNTNSTQNKSQTHRAKQYKVTSFLSTDCELSTETCSKNVYSLGPWSLNFEIWSLPEYIMRFLETWIKRSVEVYPPEACPV